MVTAEIAVEFNCHIKNCTAFGLKLHTISEYSHTVESAKAILQGMIRTVLTRVYSGTYFLCCILSPPARHLALQKPNLPQKMATL